jgi:hypothetical protein
VATPPTLVASYESAVTTSGNGFGTISSISVQTDDIVLVYARTYDNSGSNTLPNNPSVTGASLSWTTRGSVMVSGFCSSRVWTASAPSSTTISISVTGSGVSGHTKSFTVFVWRAHNGIGSTFNGNGTTGGSVPNNISLTGVTANSAIFMGNADWNAVSGARTPVTASAGSFTEETYDTGPACVTAAGDLR